MQIERELKGSRFYASHRLTRRTEESNPATPENVLAGGSREQPRAVPANNQRHHFNRPGFRASIPLPPQNATQTTV